jgi:hypothetical protein
VSTNKMRICRLVVSAVLWLLCSDGLLSAAADESAKATAGTTASGSTVSSDKAMNNADVIKLTLAGC